LTQQIYLKALELGFLACGFSKAKLLENEKEGLIAYLQNGFHGQMKYMENHFDKRLDPQLLKPGSKTVISLLYNYFPIQKQSDPEAPIISKYAYGKDYHVVIKDKLSLLLKYIGTISGEVNGRFFVDSAPILERAWAQKSGLGWIGKNGLIVNKEFGSFFFIAEILIDLELDYNSDFAQNYCGKCSRCIDACPTEAIVAPGIVDARKCISYLTIELKGEIPSEFKNKMQNRVFGCDICQDVCPFNKKSRPNSEPGFLPSPEMMNLTRDEWFNINEADFLYLFGNSAFKRTGYTGLKRNLGFIKSAEAE